MQTHQWVRHRCLEDEGMGLGGTNPTSEAGGDPENGENVSPLPCATNSETHIKIQFPKTARWGPYFIMFHRQQ